jgi:hypothetical protein
MFCRISPAIHFIFALEVQNYFRLPLTACYFEPLDSDVLSCAEHINLPSSHFQCWTIHLYFSVNTRKTSLELLPSVPSVPINHIEGNPMVTHVTF